MMCVCVEFFSREEGLMTVPVAVDPNYYQYYMAHAGETANYAIYAYPNAPMSSVISVQIEDDITQLPPWQSSKALHLRVHLYIHTLCLLLCVVQLSQLQQ